MLLTNAAIAAQSFRASCRFLRRRAQTRNKTATRARKLKTVSMTTIVAPAPWMRVMTVGRTIRIDGSRIRFL